MALATSNETDRVLARVPQDPTYPYQSVRWFHRKRRTLDQIVEGPHRPRPTKPNAFALELVGNDAIGDLIRAAHLTPKESEVLSLWLCGHSFAEIGHLLCKTRQAAHQLMRRATERLKGAYNRNPLTGMSDVYKTMVSPRSDTELFTT